MDSVKLIECPRDAWQGLPGHIPAAQKATYLRELISAGFQHIDAVSFVSPKAVPQMADSEEVLRLLGPVEEIEIIGIVVNEKGAERAVATEMISTLGFPCSISPTFLRRNQNQSPEENMTALGQIADRAAKAGLGTVVYISMAFGNPYGDPWSEDAITTKLKELAETGVNCVSLADTVGAADAGTIARVLSAVLGKVDRTEIGVHMHSTRASARERILAAYDAGCRRFDSAMGGLGGCPFAQDDLVGNIPTEEVLSALEERGVTVSIKNRLAAIARKNDAIASEYAHIR